MKKIISVLFCFIIIIGTFSSVSASDFVSIDSVIADTADYLYKKVPDPNVGSVGGEWAVLGLARSETEIPDEYYRRYYSNVLRYLEKNSGVLHDKKYTEYSRVILALTAIGKNPEDVGGCNLVAPLYDYDKTIWQGLNGPIWAVIALNSGNYGTSEIRERYINRILECELDGGGWALSEDETEAQADITAMALMALSCCETYEGVSEAVERGINKLSEMQNENGGFSSCNEETAESAAQVLAAVSSLGISYRDTRFVKNKNTLIDNLLSFYTPGNGFAHSGSQSLTSNLMATEQCFYALVAAKRLENNKNSIFDMSDSLRADDTAPTGLANKNTDVSKQEIRCFGKTFDDVQNHKNQEAVEELASRGIINGVNDASFCPDNTMTRAEFASVVVRALGVPLKTSDKFADVTPSDWFYGYVGTAYAYGIVNGISQDVFEPYGTITREEAAAMAARAAYLCGMNTDIAPSAARDILAEFADYVKVSGWASASVAFCYEQDILDRNDIEINPQKNITRAEIAQMLYNILGRSELL